MRRKLQKNRNKIQNLIPCPCLKRWVFAMVYLCHIYFNVLNFVVLMYNSKSNIMCMWSKSDGNYSLEMRYQQFRRALISNLDSRCEVYFPVFCAFRKFKNIKCFETYFCGQWFLNDKFCSTHFVSNIFPVRWPLN